MRQIGVYQAGNVWICQRFKSGLNSAEGYIRSRLAKEINLRNTPEIRFIVDESIAYGVRMSKLIDDVIKKDEEGQHESN